MKGLLFLAVNATGRSALPGFDMAAIFLVAIVERARRVATREVITFARSLSYDHPESP
jgi:hypothetical protein